MHKENTAHSDEHTPQKCSSTTFLHESTVLWTETLDRICKVTRTVTPPVTIGVGRALHFPGSPRSLHAGLSMGVMAALCLLLLLTAGLSHGVSGDGSDGGKFDVVVTQDEQVDLGAHPGAETMVGVETTLDSTNDGGRKIQRPP